MPKAPARAGIAFLAAQSSMLLGYTLWGGVKEAAAAAILALGPLTAWRAIQDSEARWPWILPGIAATAFLATLGFGGAVWVVPTMVPLLLVARRRLGKREALILAGAAVLFVVVATLPQLIGPNGLFNPFQGYLFAESELGNLRAPLSILHVIGLWPAHDFRDSPHFEVVTKIMIVVLAAMAVFAAYRAIKDRALPFAGYVVGGVAGFAVTYALGSPWIQGKAMTIISPALLTAAFVGVALLIQRTRFNIEGWLIGTVAAGLILVSSVLAFQGVYLAPRAEHRELEQIGERFDGRGPALETEGSSYGGRHFLRGLDTENAKDLRRRPVYLTNGSKPDDVPYLDTDMIATRSLSPYNLLVLRRAPAASRPPGDFRLAYAGTYYEVWQRRGSPVAGQSAGGAPAPGRGAVEQRAPGLRGCRRARGQGGSGRDTRGRAPERHDAGRPEHSDDALLVGEQRDDLHPRLDWDARGPGSGLHGRRLPDLGRGEYPWLARCQRRGAERAECAPGAQRDALPAVRPVCPQPRASAARDRLRR